MNLITSAYRLDRIQVKMHMVRLGLFQAAYS